MSHSIKIVSWNVNGLRAVLKKNFLEQLERISADVFCLQEIKAKPEQLKGIELPEDYDLYWNPAERPGYSGTLVFSRLPILSHTKGIGNEVGDSEGRVQMLEFKFFYLVNVYTPNAKRDLSRLDFRTQVWDRDFREYLKTLDENKPVVFCGDLNVAHEEIDLANPKANRGNAGFTDEEREAFSLTLNAGFADTFRRLHPNTRDAYSWWSYRAGARKRNIGWRIDYIGVSERLLAQVDEAFILHEEMGSDHCPVGAVLSFD